MFPFLKWPVLQFTDFITLRKVNGFFLRILRHFPITYPFHSLTKSSRDFSQYKIILILFSKTLIFREPIARQKLWSFIINKIPTHHGNTHPLRWLASHASLCTQVTDCQRITSRTHSNWKMPVVRFLFLFGTLRANRTVTFRL